MKFLTMNPTPEKRLSLDGEEAETSAIFLKAAHVSKAKLTDGCTVDIDVG